MVTPDVMLELQEAFLDQRVTRTEAMQVIEVAFAGMLTAAVLAFATGVFSKVVGGNPGGNPSYEEPPTPRQLRYIAILCGRLKIQAPYEEQVKTSGEAGRLIRELQAEERYRRQLAGRLRGFRVTRTEINEKMLADLEATWHRIESDMSYEMQSALGILKEVMGYHFEQPAVAAWDDSNLVGVAVYETMYDKDLQVQDTHISELASFTHKPGVGRLLVNEVIKIAKEEGSDAVTASYVAGVKEFYEKLGFVRDPRYPEAPTLMMYKLKRGR